MTSRAQRRIFAATTLIVLTSSAFALPGRFPCGTNAPNQHICDNLAASSSPRTVGVPIGSECVRESGLGYFCGWQGAKCTADSQCDFGQCTGTLEAPGICVGGLGDLCEGPDGPDDTLCAGNLGCQRTMSGEGIVGKAVCGGSGADCSFEGAYQIGTRPNHSACVSKHCSSHSLTCSTPNRPRPGRPQIRFDLPSNPKLLPPNSLDRTSRSKLLLPAGSTSCPTGFTICPIAKPSLPRPARRGGEEQGGGGGEGEGKLKGPGFEMACFDTTNSATHCGGCPSLTETGAWFGTSGLNRGSVGMDCTKMVGVESSDCIDSKCRVFSCSPNYDFDRSTGTCKPKKYW